MGAADKDKRISELERALSRLAVWATMLSSEAPEDMPLPADVAHLSLTVRDAREALMVLGRAYFDCPICEGACSTHH